MKKILICNKCENRYAVASGKWRCDCGSYFNIEPRPLPQFENLIERAPSIWRYREAYPLERDENIITLGEGLSPVIDYKIHGKTIKLKTDNLFPSGSFKDRGASVMISILKEAGISKIVEDSSGNAGAAIATYAARAGIECDIYVPSYASPAKLRQISQAGARVIPVEGTRSDTEKAALEAAEKSYYASHAFNPLFLEGTKSFIYEVWEQFNRSLPDTLVLPVGNGSLLLGVYKGAVELQMARLIDALPKIIAVQTENCAPLYSLFGSTGDKRERSFKPTIAEGVSVQKPVRAGQIVDAIRRTGGTILTVTETEIRAHLKRAVVNGLYIEPTSAVALAGTEKYLKTGDNEKSILTLLTGHGLKAGEKIAEIL